MHFACAFLQYLDLARSIRHKREKKETIEIVQMNLESKVQNSAMSLAGQERGKYFNKRSARGSSVSPRTRGSFPIDSELDRFDISRFSPWTDSTFPIRKDRVMLNIYNLSQRYTDADIFSCTA